MACRLTTSLIILGFLYYVSNFFRLFPFPTERKDPNKRNNWMKLVNRSDERRMHLWQPSKDSRVCSLHFLDGEPTLLNPNPTQNMGYNANKRAILLSPPVGKRRGRESNNTTPKKKRKELSTVQHKTSLDTTPSNNNTELCDEHVPAENDIDDLFTEYIPQQSSSNNIDIIVFVVMLVAIIHNLAKYIIQLQEMLKNLQTESEKSHFEKTLTDKNCNFYTNLKNVRLFNKLHDKIAPLVRRRYRANIESQGKREFRVTPKKMGPERKLCSHDEFLLCLMKLRLGLLSMDLAQRFNISESLCSNIFHSWIRAMAEYLKSFVYIPDPGVLYATSPKRFHQFKSLTGIIDCSEIFIETPKDLELQSATWSDYKHHNTLKFLVCVAPNSSITFISNAYTGRISDKKITLDCEFLEKIPKYCTVMADKGFNLHNECAARSLYFVVPPGRRGTSQMAPAEVSKTSAIAKVRILVEQVIRRLKTFRIIANELPITMLGHVDDILMVCSALCNFKEPIYSD